MVATGGVAVSLGAVVNSDTSRPARSARSKTPLAAATRRLRLPRGEAAASAAAVVLRGQREPRAAAAGWLRVRVLPRVRAVDRDGVAHASDIVLMDEPCSALDPIATLKVEELIWELKSEYTFVIVTHSMQQASRVSDKTAFFYLGEVVEYDDTNTMFTNPREKRTEEYISGRFG